jgi:predicted peptidase
MNKRLKFKNIIILVSLMIVLSFTSKAQFNMIKSAVNKTVPLTVELNYRYLLTIPEEKNGTDRFPLIVFLHGSGERGLNPDAVMVHGPWDFMEQQPGFPFMVLAPQCLPEECWNPVTLDLLLDDIIANYPVDTSRIYLTGLSMGGRGVFDWAIYHPDRFAAIAPVCGATGNHSFMAHKLLNIPVWIFHGALDDIIPLENTAKVVQKLRDLGGDVSYTVYPLAGHDSWTETYLNEELYQWMLSKSLHGR